MRNTMRAIREHKAAILNEYPEEQVLGIFLYGSQNYGINTENSDVDTKAIIIPTFDDLTIGGNPISREIHFQNGEHCEVKDIRLISDMFKKQNLNFLEILFTDYCWINPRFNAIWRTYFANHAEEICHMNEAKAVKSITGQIISSLKRKTLDEKGFANGLRMYYFLKSYLTRKPYYDCFDATMLPIEVYDEIMVYKKREKKPTEEDVEQLLSLVQDIEKDFVVDEYDARYKLERGNKILNEGVQRLIKESIKGEFI